MPVKCPCEVCLRPCKRNQCAIQCDMCGGWIHLKCTVINPLKFHTHCSSTEPYFCQICYSELFPFQTLDDKQLLNEMRNDDKLNFDINRGGVEDTRLEAKAKAKDSLSEDKHSRGQGQECSRPRPRTKDTKRKCSPKKKKKKKKRSSQKFFKRSPLKNVFQKIFQALRKILTFQKILLSSSRGQANFRGLEASRPRPRPRTSKCVLEDSTSGY